MVEARFGFVVVVVEAGFGFVFWENKRGEGGEMKKEKMVGDRKSVV